MHQDFGLMHCHLPEVEGQKCITVHQIWGKKYVCKRGYKGVYSRHNSFELFDALDALDALSRGASGIGAYCLESAF